MFTLVKFMLIAEILMQIGVKYVCKKILSLRIIGMILIKLGLIIEERHRRFVLVG